MPTASHAELPVVSVIHFKVGEDRSISVQDFVRSLKRDRNSRPTLLNAQKRQRRSPPLGPHRGQESWSNVIALPTVDNGLSLHHGYQEFDEEIIPIGLGAIADSALDEEPDHRSSRTSTATIKVRKTYQKRRLEPVNPPCSSGQGLIDEDHQTRNPKGDLDPAMGTEEMIRNRKKRSRRHAPVNELPLISTIHAPAVPDILDDTESVFADQPNESCNRTAAPEELRVPTYVKHKQVAGRQPIPISSIKKSICLSKATDINLRNFRLPPKTPSSARSKVWKPGSGFKGAAKAKAIKKSAGPEFQNQDTISDLTQLVYHQREHQECSTPRKYLILISGLYDLPLSLRPQHGKIFFIQAWPVVQLESDASCEKESRPEHFLTSQENG
ncbi:MAG: hypothetical protein Q9194_002602 [Teloschistes cf. exilis]